MPGGTFVNGGIVVFIALRYPMALNIQIGEGGKIFSSGWKLIDKCTFDNIVLYI